MQQPWFCSENQVLEINENFLKNNSRPIQRLLRVSAYNPSANGPNLSEGIWAAIGIGVALFVVSIVVLVFLFVKKRRVVKGSEDKKLLF